MTPQEAADIARQRDALAVLPPTHELAALQRRAAARLRMGDARRYREQPSPQRRLEADFAQIFGA